MAGPQLWTCGPCDIYVGFQSGQTGTNPAGVVTAYYLGTCEDKPDVEIIDHHDPVFNALKGNRAAFDKQYKGQSAAIVVPAGRWDEAVYAQLAAQPLCTPQSVRGKLQPGDIGTLAFQEGYAVCVWLKFAYQAYAAFSGMPAGYRFPGCTLENTRLDNLNTDTRVTPLVFSAESVYNTGDGSFTLYDHNMTGLPART